MSAESTPPEQDRRIEARYPVLLDARVKVPLVDLGPPILAANAQIEELSLNGARIYIPSLDKKQLRALAQMRDKFSLVYRLPGTESLSYIWADLVWVDIRPCMVGTSVRLGLDLTKMLPTERHHLEQFLRRVAKQSAT